jgi:membrane protease YdiL (CAAX protease family)
VSEPPASIETSQATPEPGLSRSQQRVIAVIEILLCSSIPTQVLIASLLGALGLAPRTPDDQLSLPFVFALSIADTALLTTLMVVFMRVHGESPWLLWRGRRPLVSEVSLGLALVPVTVVAAGLLMASIITFFPSLHNVPTNPFETLAAGGHGDAAMMGLIAIVAGGLREELQRAFLLQRFEQHLGGAAAGVVVLSTAFGLGHVLQGWDASVTTGLLGAFWAVLYLWRRSCIAPILSHAGFNSIEVLRVAIGLT